MNITNAPQSIRRPVKAGIVHIGGTSRFFRSHLASYIHDLVQIGEGDDWGIYAVSLRNESLCKKLAENDGWYNLIELDNKGIVVRQIGAVKNFFYGPKYRNEILQKMTSNDIKIISLTITANGYCLDPNTGKLNQNLEEIQHDMTSLETPVTALGYIVQALSIRRRNGIPPFVVVSCDNLLANGVVSKEAIVGFASLVDRDLGTWIENNVTFPNTMADRITPKTPSNIANIDLDICSVISEGFRQFVIEEKFPFGRPPWEKVGVEMVENAEPYYLMKLTLLNGTHTVIGLLASQLKIKYVYQCFQHRSLAKFLKKIINEEFDSVLPTTIASLDKYKETILNRLANANIEDQVSRLTCDLTRKIKKYILPAIKQGIKKGASIARLCFVVATWINSSSGFDEHGNSFDFLDSQADGLSSFRKCIQEAFITNGNDTRQVLQQIQAALKKYPQLFEEELSNSTLFVQSLTASLKHYHGTENGLRRFNQEFIHRK